MTREEAEEVLAYHRCTTPGGGVHPGGHCAACCYGTGYVVTCQEEQDEVDAALALIGATS